MVLSEHFTARSSSQAVFKSHEVAMRLRCPYRSAAKARTKIQVSVKKSCQDGSVPSSQCRGHVQLDCEQAPPRYHHFSLDDDDASSTNQDNHGSFQIRNSLEALSLQQAPTRNRGHLVVENHPKSELSQPSTYMSLVEDTGDGTNNFPIIEWSNEAQDVHVHKPIRLILPASTRRSIPSIATRLPARHMKRCKSFESNLCLLESSPDRFLYPE